MTNDLAPVFTNFNEDGQEYARHDNLEDAMKLLRQFPNDSIAVTLESRLDYLRGEIRAGRISYSEIAELQSLAEHIEPGDVELLEWAGVPEGK